MNDDSHSPDKENKSQRSWLERLGQALQGELKDREQLHEVLQQAQKNQVIDIDALSMIDGVIEVAEMQVRDIMIPRAQMVVVERDHELNQVLPVVTESAHSRFPVIDDDRAEVVGILLAKDLLAYCDKEGRRFDIRGELEPTVLRAVGVLVAPPFVGVPKGTGLDGGGDEGGALPDDLRRGGSPPRRHPQSPRRRPGRQRLARGVRVR